MNCYHRLRDTLENMFRKLVSDDPRSWDKIIDFIMFAYREVPYVMTGFSPFELMYGMTVVFQILKLD